MSGFDIAFALLSSIEISGSERGGTTSERPAPTVRRTRSDRAAADALKSEYATAGIGSADMEEHARVQHPPLIAAYVYTSTPIPSRVRLSCGSCGEEKVQLCHFVTRAYCARASSARNSPLFGVFRNDISTCMVGAFTLTFRLCSCDILMFYPLAFLRPSPRHLISGNEAI